MDHLAREAGKNLPGARGDQDMGPFVWVSKAPTSSMGILLWRANILERGVWEMLWIIQIFKNLPDTRRSYSEPGYLSTDYSQTWNGTNLRMSKSNNPIMIELTDGRCKVRTLFINTWIVCAVKSQNLDDQYVYLRGELAFWGFASLHLTPWIKNVVIKGLRLTNC